LNSFGTVFLVGGSLLSIVRRQRIRTNLWIGGGALVVGLATGLSRAGSYEFVYAGELLGITPAASNLIRQGKLDQLENTMQSGGQFGMRSMDSAIQQLVDQRQITGQEAYKKAINKAKFEEFKSTA